MLFRGPVNEDVFAAPPFHGGKIVDSDIQEISEQIHRLLLQVWTHAHTLDYGINICIPAFNSLCNHLFFPPLAADPQHGLQRLWQPRQQRFP